MCVGGDTLGGGIVDAEPEYGAVTHRADSRCP